MALVGRENTWAAHDRSKWIKVPNRIIKESALISQDLSKLSDGAERLFWRLLLVADDFGRFDAYPPVVKARCFPTMVESLKINAVQNWMAELEPDLVRYYSREARRYGFFINWEKHQQKRAKMSKFPDPPEVQQNPDDSNCNQLQSNVPVFVFEKRDRDRDRDTVASGFDEFWISYPRKIGKKKAEGAWNKIHPDETLREKITAALERHKQSRQWLKDSGEFIPHPTTWLNGRRWEDETDETEENPDDRAKRIAELVTAEKDGR